MIVDHRTYDFHPGKMAPWLDQYESHALPLQQKYLGTLIGFFTTTIGPINQAVFLWAYDSIGDREERRARMEVDSDWIEYRKLSGGMGALKQQTNKILVPTAFSPLK
jgi:hypothetical protein